MRLIVLTFLLGFLSLQAQALESWYLPIENQLKNISIRNLSANAQDLWISGPIASASTEPEVYFSIPAQSEVEISLDEFREYPWIHLKANNESSFEFYVSEKKLKLFKIEQGNSNHWNHLVNKSENLLILNTSAVDQNIKLRRNFLTTNYLIKAFDKLETSVTAGEVIDIQGEQRFTALTGNGNTWKYLTDSSVSVPWAPPQDSSFSYFLFSDKENSQSFIVKLDDKVLIEQARNQILSPEKYPKKILIAQISLGHGNANRDWFHTNRSPWSWHVAKAMNFADFASQECDGSPGFIDEFAKTWTQSPGVICFWNYKVEKELTQIQVLNGK